MVLWIQMFYKLTEYKHINNFLYYKIMVCSTIQWRLFILY